MDQTTEIKTGRRRFLASLGVLGAAGLCPVALAGTEPSVATTGAPVLKAGPYLQFAGPGQMTVRWITNVPCLSWVEYGFQPGQTDRKAETVKDGLVEACNTVHAITLQGLNPGQPCYYRICSREIKTFEPYNVVYGDTWVSPVYSFRTVSGSDRNISFLVFNDIHNRPESFSQLLQYQSPGQKNFMLFNGDIFNYMTGEDQIVHNFLEPLAAISPGMPFVYARGNHETRGNFARHLSEYVNRGTQGFYYSFVAGPACCIVLDSGEDKPDDNREYFGLADFDPYRLAQREWLKQEIKKEAFRKAKYKIVFSHIPLYYSGDWHGSTYCREVWGDVLNEAKIDVLISAHTHTYGIHPRVAGQHNYPIVIGGGPKDGTRSLIEVNMDEHSFHLSLKDDQGTVKGELAI